MLNVSIYRYNPEVDAEPYMQDYQIDTQGKDLMVLDVWKSSRLKTLHWYSVVPVVKVSVVQME